MRRISDGCSSALRCDVGRREQMSKPFLRRIIGMVLSFGLIFVLMNTVPLVTPIKVGVFPYFMMGYVMHIVITYCLPWPADWRDKLSPAESIRMRRRVRRSLVLGIALVLLFAFVIRF